MKHKNIERVKDREWHYDGDRIIERILCNLFDHKIVNPSSEIEQCKLCYKWRYK